MPAIIAFARTVLLVAAVLALLPAQARAEWLRAETPNFIVYGQSGLERLREQASELEDFNQLLRQLTGVTAAPTAKLNIYIVRGTAEMRQIWPGGSAGVGGFYTASPDGILAVVDTQAGRGWVGRNEILFHEYAHHFMLQYFPAVYPRWYVEGFAEYLATARFDGDTIEYGRRNEARASWLGDRLRWLPLDRILFGDPSDLRDTESVRFYSQSWLLVHYLLRDGERMRQLNRYLAAVSQGQPPRAAFQAAFGMSDTQMQRQLNAYVTREITYTRLRRQSASQPPQIAIARLPNSAEDLLLLDASMRGGMRVNGQSIVRRARRVAAQSPDPFARRVLARAEALYGDGAAAERLIGELLQASPRDAELLYLMGMRHLVAGRADAASRARHFRTAQTWFSRAHRADENHYQTLYRYAESLSEEPAFLSENTTNILLLAHQLAPQAEAIRLSAANLLMRREQWTDAEAMLTPLASHPHGGAMTRIARALLEKTRARDRSGLPHVFETPEEDQE